MEQSSLATSAATTINSAVPHRQTMSKTVRKELKVQSTLCGVGYVQTLSIRTVDTEKPAQGPRQIVYTEKRICPAYWTRVKGFTSVKASMMAIGNIGSNLDISSHATPRFSRLACMAI